MSIDELAEMMAKGLSDDGLLYSDDSSIPSVTRALKADLLNHDRYASGYVAALEAAANMVDAPFGDKPERQHIANQLRDEAKRVAEFGIAAK